MIKYLWLKLCIFVLTPIVWIKQKYDEYKEWRLRTYVQSQIMMEQFDKMSSQANA